MKKRWIRVLFTLGLALPLQAMAAARQAPTIEQTVGDTRIKVSFITDRIVHVAASRNAHWSAKPSLMRARVAERPGRITLRDQGPARILQSARLRVEIDRASGAIRFYDGAGRQLLREDAAAPRALEAVPVIKSVADPATVKTVKTVDGERQVASSHLQKQDRMAWKATARFRLDDDEALYGLGFDETADLNLRGATKRLYQHNLRVVVPFVVSTRGYGILFDTYSAMTFNDGKDGTAVTSDVVDELGYYFILGPSMDQAIGGFRQLTGAAVPLPKWAFGYVQSKERYRSQDELVDTVKQFRQRQIPLDVIVQDWNYWKPDHWGSPVPDAQHYPDLSAMTKAVHDLQAKVMISIWPNPSPLDPPGKELKDGGFFSAGSNYVDFFQPKAADVYFRHVWHYLGRHGMDAWWTDSTEPEVGDWGGDTRPADADQVNVAALSRVIDPQHLNAYALVAAQGMLRNWRQAAPDKRMVNLTRSGYAGSQATGAMIWTGDISARWPVLAQQVAAIQSFSASGLPYVTTDVGAFFVGTRAQWFWKGDYKDGVADLGYRELYTRWMQFGALLPMFRSHGTDTPREPWHFGEPGTQFHDAILDAIRLRYRLLPYIYSQAGLVYLRGESFIRPVAFAYPEDKRTHNLASQMLLGEGMMVSPVTVPMYYGANSAPIDGVARSREVYLPQGQWIDFWTGLSLSGGRTVQAEAPIGRIPLHVRAGSIIPMGPAVQYTAQQRDTPVELRIYPGKDGAFTLYEDAGEGWGYERGEHALIGMRWDQRSGRLLFKARQGKYPGMAATRRFKAVLVGPGVGVGAAPVGKAVDIDYDGRAMSIDLR